MNGQSNFYTVKKGDTLGKIAKENGTTFESLKKINGLKNAHKIDIGQRIALRPEAVCGIGALFLDRDRNSIKDLVYRIERCGKIFNGITGENGKTKSLLTETPDDPVKIWVKRLDGSWKLVTTVVSGFGNKLVTLISGHMMVQATTEKHPDLPPSTKPNSKERQKPLHDKRPAPTTNKKELGLKVTPVKTLNGKPLTKVEGDIPDLSFLGDYVGGEITKADIEAAAIELKCEAGLIYAIARQESAHSSFIKIGNRTVPTILFERHQFSRRSQREYDKTYPDISGKAYQRARKNKGGEWIEKNSGKVVSEDNIYGPGGIAQYRRLVKAYQLNQDAALMACSWGKFQIMGFNHKAAGFKDVKDFVKAMSRSDAEHMKAFLKFAKSNPMLLDGLQNKNFEKIAEGHNGAKWRLINPEYASNLEKFHNEYSSSK